MSAPTTAPQLFVTRPVTVEAMQYNGMNSAEIVRWADDSVRVYSAPDPAPDPTVNTDGMLLVVNTVGATIGDWVIRGTYGQLYLRNPGVFVSSYAPVL